MRRADSQRAREPSGSRRGEVAFVLWLMGLVPRKSAGPQ